MPDHKTLFEALAAVQAEMPTLPKDGTNPHFRSKFTPLDTIVEQTTPILSNHGLAWSARPSYDEAGNPTLKYTLAHGVSGEREDGEMLLLLSKTDPQGQGAAITYARRYAISAVLNIVADEDVDGEGIAPTKPRAKSASKKAPPAAKAPAEPAKSSAEKFEPSQGAITALLSLAQEKGLRTAQGEGQDPEKLFRFQLGALGIANEGEVYNCLKAVDSKDTWIALYESVDTCDAAEPPEVAK